MFIQQNMKSYLGDSNNYKESFNLFNSYMIWSNNTGNFNDQLGKIKNEFNNCGYMTNADLVSLLTILKVKCKFIDYDINRLTIQNDDEAKNKIKLNQSKKTAIETFVHRLEIALNDRFKDMSNVFDGSIFSNKSDIIDKIINYLSATDPEVMRIHGNMKSMLSNFGVEFADLQSVYKIENFDDLYNSSTYNPGNLHNGIIIIVCILIAIAFIYAIQYFFDVFRGFDDIDDIIPTINDSRNLMENNAFITLVATVFALIICYGIAYIGYIFTSWGVKNYKDKLQKNLGANVVRLGLFNLIDTLVDLVYKKSDMDLMIIFDKICADMLFDGFEFDKVVFDDLNKRMKLVAQLNKWSEEMLKVDMTATNVKESIVKVLRDIQDTGVYDNVGLEISVENAWSKSEIKDDIVQYCNLKHIVDLIKKCGEDIDINAILTELLNGVNHDDLMLQMKYMYKNSILDNNMKHLNDTCRQLLKKDFDKDTDKDTKDAKESFYWHNNVLDSIFDYKINRSNSKMLKGDFNDKRKMSVFDTGVASNRSRDVTQFESIKDFVYRERRNVESCGELLEKCDIKYYIDMLPAGKDDKYKSHVEFFIKNRYLFGVDIIADCTNTDTDGKNVLNLDNNTVFKRICQREEIGKLVNEYCKTNANISKLIESSKEFVIASLIFAHGDTIFKTDVGHEGEFVDDKLAQSNKGIELLLNLLHRIIDLFYNSGDPGKPLEDIKDLLAKGDLESILIFCKLLYQYYHDLTLIHVTNDKFLGDAFKVRGAIKVCKFDFWKDILNNGYENVGIYRRSFNEHTGVKDEIFGALKEFASTDADDWKVGV
jgi:hypothetical protein